MKLRFIYFLLVCFFMHISDLTAQRKADRVFTFDSDIESILLNPFTGSIIVKDRDAIQSYNPENNAIEWKILDKEISQGNSFDNVEKALDNIATGDFAKLMEKTKDEIKLIPNSPFISLTIDKKDVIINILSGKVVFNSGTLGCKLLETEFMPDEKSFLLMVVDNKAYSCLYYDLETGKEKWRTELASVESFMKSLGSLISFSSENVVEDKVVTTAKDIFVTIGGTLYKLGKTDGKIGWKTDFKLSDFYLSQNHDRIIAIRSSGGLFSSKVALNILDTKTGAKLWKDDVSTKYITYLEDWKDRILVAHSSGFNFYSYADGKKIWKKDAKGDKIKKVISVGNDYLYVADKEMNLIDKDGQNKWKKIIEICDNKEDEVYYLGKVDNNRVFYLTDSYGNMVDYTSGKKIWKKNISFDKNRPLLYSYDEGKNIYLVYNDKKLYKFDPNATDKPEEFAKLKKINDDKSMESIELFDWGVALVGQSDVIGVSFDGETRYHNTYKEPGGGQRKFLKGAGAVGQGVLGFRSGLKKSFANAQVTVTTRDESGRVVEKTSDLMTEESKAKMLGSAQKDDMISGAIGSNLTNRMSQRFNALKHTGEYAFVLDKADGGGAQLVKVRKTDGEEIDKILIDNNKPIYEVDPLTDNIYYVTGKELKIYNKK